MAPTNRRSSRTPPGRPIRCRDVVEAGGLEQLDEVTLAGPRKFRFVLSAGIELPNRRPEQTEGTSPTGVVPDAGDHAPVRAGDSRHLAQAADGIRHEMHDELREGNVELVIGKGQRLRGGTSNVDAGVPVTRSVHKWLRGVDGRHCLGAEPRYELAGQGAGPASHVQRSLPLPDSPEVGKHWGKLH